MKNKEKKEEWVKMRVRMMKGNGRIGRKEKKGRRIYRGWKESSKSFNRYRSYLFYGDV
jgi:hypothetical protein